MKNKNLILPLILILGIILAYFVYEYMFNSPKNDSNTDNGHVKIVSDMKPNYFYENMISLNSYGLNNSSLVVINQNDGGGYSLYLAFSTNVDGYGTTNNIYSWDYGQKKISKRVCDYELQKDKIKLILCSVNGQVSEALFYDPKTNEVSN
jgi:hypothetical protein